ncbi:TPA: hypothetical protein TXL52_001231 [Streptococcus suis]|nr:hypothetical protein [Streptococcus suis]
MLPDVKVIPVDGIKYGFADFKGAGLVEEAVDLPKDLWLKSDAEQFIWLDEQIGGSRLGMTWHIQNFLGEWSLFHLEFIILRYIMAVEPLVCGHTQSDKRCYKGEEYEF